jgi:hypothetical protein
MKQAFVMLTEKREILALISVIASTGTALDGNIHQAAVSCLDHAEKHGDVTLASRLVEAMPRSSRKAALIHWFEQFGPLVFDKEKTAFHISRKKEKAPYRVSEAVETPFYDYTTERNPAPFSIERLFKSVTSKLQKAKENGEIDGEGLAKFQQAVASLSL